MWSYAPLLLSGRGPLCRGMLGVFLDCSFCSVVFFGCSSSVRLGNKPRHPFSPMGLSPAINSNFLRDVKGMDKLVFHTFCRENFGNLENSHHPSPRKFIICFRSLGFLFCQKWGFVPNMRPFFICTPIACTYESWICVQYEMEQNRFQSCDFLVNHVSFLGRYILPFLPSSWK